MNAVVMGPGKPREVPCRVAGCRRRFPVWDRNVFGERISWQVAERRHVREMHRRTRR